MRVEFGLRGEDTVALGALKPEGDRGGERCRVMPNSLEPFGALDDCWVTAFSYTQRSNHMYIYIYPFSWVTDFSVIAFFPCFKLPHPPL